MFHKFVDIYIATINHILHTYAYIKSYLKIIPNLFLIFIAIFIWAMLCIRFQQIFIFENVCAVYARALG